MDNTILVTKYSNDLEIGVSTDNIRLTIEELNLLADQLWRHSWEIDCDLVCTNDKVSQYWVFGLFPDADLDFVAKSIEKVIQDLFSDKFVKIN